MQLALLTILANWMTHPMPMRAKPVDPLLVNPAHEVPVAPETYRWQIRPFTKGATFAGVYAIGYERNPFGVGTIAADTEIKLEEFTQFGQTTYYAVPAGSFKVSSPTQFPPDTRFWVRGLDIKATARKPDAK